MLLYKYKQILEAGALKSLGTLSSKALESKAAKGIIRYGQLLLGDKKNQTALQNIIDKAKKDIKIRTLSDRIERNALVSKRSQRVRNSYPKKLTNDEFMEHIIKQSNINKIREQRIKDAINKHVGIHYGAEKDLKLSRLGVNLSRGITGTAVGIGVVGYGNKKIKEYKESKKTKLEKLKDKIKDIVTKD